MGIIELWFASLLDEKLYLTLISILKNYDWGLASFYLFCNNLFKLEEEVGIFKEQVDLWASEWGMHFGHLQHQHMVLTDLWK